MLFTQLTVDFHIDGFSLVIRLLAKHAITMTCHWITLNKLAYTYGRLNVEYRSTNETIVSDIFIYKWDIT